ATNAPRLIWLKQRQFSRSIMTLANLVGDLCQLCWRGAALGFPLRGVPAARGSPSLAARTAVGTDAMRATDIAVRHRRGARNRHRVGTDEVRATDIAWAPTRGARPASRCAPT